MEILQDELITPCDIEQMQSDLDTMRWTDDVIGIALCEPNLLWLISTNFVPLYQRLLTYLPEHQQKQLARDLMILVWSPLIVMRRAHRRLWDDYLPNSDGSCQPPPNNDTDDKTTNPKETT